MFSAIGKFALNILYGFLFEKLGKPIFAAIIKHFRRKQKEEEVTQAAQRLEDAKTEHDRFDSFDNMP